MIWEIKAAKWDEAQELLADGWEPFTVTVETESHHDYETEVNYIWLRRKVKK